jgi:hypothetical protein
VRRSDLVQHVLSPCRQFSGSSWSLIAAKL